MIAPQLNKLEVVCALFLLGSCIVTPTPSPIITPTPPVSSLITPTPHPSPIVTPTNIPPRVEAAQVPTSLQNADFEGKFTVRGNAVTLAEFWQYWQLNNPPCRPGSLGCDIPCPSNCIITPTVSILGIPLPNGVIPLNVRVCPIDDQGCFWAQPEFAAAYRPDYNPPRAYSGLWAQKTFVYGREGRFGLYQQVQIETRSILTFTAYFEAWQCFDYDHCSLQSVKVGGSPSDPPPNPERALFLMKQWGCLPLDLEGDGYKRCKLWAASDRPYKMHMKVGIDPTGGTDATSPTVIWGQEIESFDYWSQAIVTATMQNAGTATVFTYSSPSFDYARTSNDQYIDNAELQIQSLAPYKIYFPR